MVEIDRIYFLAKEQGIKIGFLCQQIGVNEAYFRQAKAKNVIPENIIEKAANILNTTTDYLHGKTDIKEKATAKSDGLTDKEMKWLNIFRSLSEDEQKVILKMFSSKQE